MSLTKTAIRFLAGDGVAASYGRWEDRADRYWHRAFSGLVCLLVAQTLGWGLARQVVAVAVGAAFGGGAWSPDCDQYAWFRRLDKIVPDEWLGHGGPLGHHRITHSPWIPAAGIWWVAGTPGTWPLTLVFVAWIGHDLGDVLIGRGGKDVPCGPPWFLWWKNWGLGVFRSGGRVCMAATVACWVGVIWRLWSVGTL